VESKTEASPLPEHDTGIMDANIRAMDRYRPKPFPGGLTIFLTHDTSSAAEPLMHQVLGWRSLAKGRTDVKMIPGNHFSLLRAPHVATLAAKLKECIQAINLKVCSYFIAGKIPILQFVGE
jgi:thioesterase domain-containing protein